MTLIVEDVVPIMLHAAEKPFRKNWPAVSTCARQQLTRIAEEIAAIEHQRSSAAIGKDDSREALDAACGEAVRKLAAVQGVSLQSARTAVNSALGAVTSMVNNALGYHLIE